MKISHINIGCGNDLSIAELANVITDIIGFQGEVRYDSSKPDGAPQKLLDVTRLKTLGWAPVVSLQEGIRKSYEWYLEHQLSKK